MGRSTQRCIRRVKLHWPSLLALLLLLVTSCALHAQALPAGLGPGSFTVSAGSGYASFQSDYSKRRLGGGFAYADYNLTQNWGAEFETRILRQGEEVGTHETTFLIGPKYTYPVHHTAPFGKLLVGVGKFHFPYDYAEGSYFVVGIGGGVDIPVRASRFTIRAVDFEYQSWPNFSFNELHPWGISTGASFRLH